MTRRWTKEAMDKTRTATAERRSIGASRKREFLINRIIAVIFAALVLLALLHHEDTAWDPAERTADLVAKACWFEIPDWLTVSCYRLRVPETREISLRTGRSITPHELMLPVVVVHAHKEGDVEMRADPIVYLAGGPGGGAGIDADQIDWWWFEIDRRPWLSSRDVVLFDQRGSGLVEPRMDCPDSTQSALARLAIVYGAEADRLWWEDVRRCAAFVVAAGHNAAAYTTVDNAEDLHDLFVAMNLSEWNVYGVSYGTRLALEYMRRHPADIRSVILDSVLPPQAQMREDRAGHMDRAIRYLLEQCAGQGICNHAYPDLASRLQKLVERLDQEPLTMMRSHPDGSGADGSGADGSGADGSGADGSGEVLVRIDGARLLLSLYLMLYSRDDIEYVPQMIDSYDRENWADIHQDADSFVRGTKDREDFGDAMKLSIECFEEAPFNDLAKANAAFAQFPMLKGMAQNPPWGSADEACEIWRQTFAVDERRASDTAPVVSDLPTLLLSGSYDPVTPPVYAHMAAETLRNGYLLEFAHYGHGVLGDALCANEIVESFLDSPDRSPDRTCLKKVRRPNFAHRLQE